MSGVCFYELMLYFLLQNKGFLFIIILLLRSYVIIVVISNYLYGCHIIQVIIVYQASILSVAYPPAVSKPRVLFPTFLVFQIIGIFTEVNYHA